MITCIMAILFNAIAGATIGTAAGFDPVASAIGMNGISALVGLLPMEMGILREGVYKEIWTGEVVKRLDAELFANWLEGVPDHSNLVENDVIHLVDVGVEPEVLINNSTYPIPEQAITDEDIPIGLDKFQTKVTPVTDDELHAISYDKMSRVIGLHEPAISKARYRKAAHAICCAKNTDKTPVLITTGEVDPVTGRKRLVKADLVRMKTAMDNLGIPTEGRRLILSSDHVQDILLFDENFVRQYSLDNVNGKVGRLYGFDIYEYSATPYYTTSGEKKALDATGEDGEFRCSFAFYKNRLFRASGSLKMYFSRAETDPEHQRNRVAFRNYFICMPQKQDCAVVMVSGYEIPSA